MPELEAFFHDLRALRASADLSLAELAVLARFREEALAGAETGPAVPPNPVLVAYVQACGGPVGQWEDRWRAASAADADGFSVQVPEPSGARQAAASGGRPGRRAAIAAVAVTLAAAGKTGARTAPAPQMTYAAQMTPAPQMTSAPQMPSRPHMTSAPRTTSVSRVAGVGCPA